MQKQADVVVIGGGVVGLSIAYNLIKKNIKPLVLEKNLLLGDGSTGKCAGGIRQQFSSETNILLSMESVRFFENFKKKMDYDIDFKQNGYLFLLSEYNLGAFEKNVILQRSLGLDVNLISNNEIKKIAPFLNLEGIVAGTFCKTDGYADPNGVVQGFAKQAKNLGAEILTETEVLGINLENNKIKSVKTSNGEIKTSIIVNAAGPYSHIIGNMVNLDILTKPYRRQIVITEKFDKIDNNIPMIVDFDSGLYFRKESGGVLMGMSDKEEPSSFNTNTDLNYSYKILESALHRAPILEEATINLKKAWAGLYSITSDDNPFLGKTKIEGFYCAVGFSGHGFMHSPAVGKVIAELINNERLSIDISLLSIDREFNTKEKNVI